MDKTARIAALGTFVGMMLADSLAWAEFEIP